MALMSLTGDFTVHVQTLVCTCELCTYRPQIGQVNRYFISCAVFLFLKLPSSMSVIPTHNNQDFVFLPKLKSPINVMDHSADGSPKSGKYSWMCVRPQLGD